MKRVGYAMVIALTIAVGATAGCRSSDRATLTGSLSHNDGSPLAGARVIATSSETGKSAHGTTDAQGRFELGTVESGDGIGAGNYNMIIVEDRGDPDNRRAPTIAAKYGDSGKSGIKTGVKAGEAARLDLKLDPP